MSTANHATADGRFILKCQSHAITRMENSTRP
jgi:hypothetical protein